MKIGRFVLPIVLSLASVEMLGCNPFGPSSTEDQAPVAADTGSPATAPDPQPSCADNAPAPQQQQQDGQRKQGRRRMKGRRRGLARGGQGQGQGRGQGQFGPGQQGPAQPWQQPGANPDAQL